MKTFECRVYVTVTGNNAEEAVGKVEAALDYMLGGVQRRWGPGHG